MPWHDLDRPSLAQGLLLAVTRTQRPRWRSSQLSANLLLIDHLRTTGSTFGIGDYGLIADNLVWDLVGDWLFTPSAFPGCHSRSTGIERLCREKGLDFGALLALRDALPGYCDSIAAEVLARDPDVVGFTTTFMQSVASLAVARRVKEAAPSTVIAFGGANCEGPMGEALLRNFPVIDVVVSGAGEHALIDVLDAVERDGQNAVQGWRSKVVSSADQVDLEHSPNPEYDDYFTLLERTALDAELDVRLVVEASRGCWWGELRHCTFCGINGSDMAYRSKSFERFVGELDYLTARHQVRRLAMNDNIMPIDWAEPLARWAMDAETELEMFWEIKSSLDYTEIAQLAAAGCTLVQPGIESLSNESLRVMRKGVTAAQNVALLVAARSVGMDVAWSQLYGFPGENAEWFGNLMAQSWRLHHLPPPMGAVRILLERFSPNFTDPSLGFRASARPHSAFRDVFPMLGDEELEDLAFMFECDSQGLDESRAMDLAAMTGSWGAAHAASDVSFRAVAGGGWRIIEERPSVGVSQTHDVSAEVVDLLDLLRRPAGIEGIRSWGGERAVDLLRQLDEKGLVFNDGRAWVSIVDFGERLLADGLRSLSGEAYSDD